MPGPESPQLGFDEFAPKPKPPILSHPKAPSAPTQSTEKPKEWLPNGRGEPGDPDYVKPDNRY